MPTADRARLPGNPGGREVYWKGMSLQRLCSSFRPRLGPAIMILLLSLGAAACASAPRFQGMTSVDLHELGQREFDRGKYDDAIQALDRLLFVFPDYPQAAEVRFLLARAYYEDKQYLLASDEFMRVLDRHITSAVAPESALWVCRSYVALSPIIPRDQTHTRQAAQVCRDVEREYAAWPVAEEAGKLADEMRAKLAEAEFVVGQHYFRRRMYDSAILYWDMLVDEFWDTAWAPDALLGISRAYSRIGYEDDAEQYCARLMTSYPDSRAAREARENSDC
jgi:outer membrane protein assembly factor BamD